MSTIRALIGVSWAVFWVYWFILGARSKRSLGGRGYQRWIRLVIFLLIIVGVRSSFLLHGNLEYGLAPHHGLALVLSGFVLFVAGIALAVWARVYLGRNWGMPMSYKAEPELVTTGPYAYIRHPIYSGILIAMLGTALASGAFWFVPLVAFGAYFIYAARQEELLMGQTFPKVYPKYVATTKMLIPFVF